MFTYLVKVSEVTAANNNNEYLEHLTRTDPKRLHVLYKYMYIAKIQSIQHECTHTDSLIIRLSRHIRFS